ncbi:hypothetical protein [Enterococcus faecium]|uniref:Uncharacterized protein n=1 Tax=Enterococcus faecium TaxID=1352 RepID=A0A242BEQ7_ENTFC|nr:hypothetical protein [Enterococcus faecium]OTN93650.1 hypothetical protein A5810_001526 [Enterococcus faecium]
MLITTDAFFLEELQRNGLDLTYVALRQMYTKSRIRNREAVEKERRTAKRECDRRYWHKCGKYRKKEREKTSDRTA